MRILIADDDPINRSILQSFLQKWGYEVLLAHNGEEAWNILQQEGSPTLAILDWVMPDLDGLQICRNLRQRAAQPYVYVLLLTANYDKKDVIVGLDAGADDYLTKPFDANELRARLRAGMRILELHEQFLSSTEQLKFQAMHDSLTGVASRAAILETLNTELNRARRQGSSVGVLMADIDHFKKVNDGYGHLAGDAVLRETAKRMRASVRPYDSIGRYGGEEFLVVVPGCDLAGATSRAEQLRQAIGSELIDTPEGRISVTLSIGVAVGGGLEEPDDEGLLRSADIALYRAKNAGRNQVALAADRQSLGLLEHLSGKEDLSGNEDLSGKEAPLAR